MLQSLRSGPWPSLPNPSAIPSPSASPPRTKKRAKKGAAHLNKSDQDTYRLLIDIGLAFVERIDYDIPRAIVQASPNTLRPPDK